MKNAIALLVYEYLITFSAEVDLFWRRKPTAASVLFFANRYMVLINNVMDLCGSHSSTVAVSTPSSSAR